jgi:CRP/FNR family transcriptional regulator
MSSSSAELFKFLSSIEPFKSLGPDDLRRVSSTAREKDFSRGETIFNEGEDADSVWVLQKGRIQILKFTTDGRPFAIESLASGELFGTLCRMGGKGRSYPCTAMAASDAEVIQIPDKTFIECYMRSPGMVRGICALCSERLKDVQDLRCMGQESVPVRVATILARLEQVHGEILPFTKKEIAELAGTTIETTFRTLAQFQKKKLLSSLRGKIQIRDAQALKDISENL